MEYIDEKRMDLLKASFNHYSFESYKLWAIDKIAELVQQMARLRTPRKDKEELIRTALMVEDAICLLWMLLDNEKELIHEIKEDVYCEFEKMLKEAHCEVVADRHHELPVSPKSPNPMSSTRV
jgi:hypothetical protein